MKAVEQVEIRSAKEIESMARAGALLREVRDRIGEKVRPGVTTRELDRAAKQMIDARGAIPAFLGYQGFPASTCISVDEVIIHGIPNDRKLQEGEICSIDVGVKYKGYYGDAALSIPCGELDPERARLMWVSFRSSR